MQTLAPQRSTKIDKLTATVLRRDADFIEPQECYRNSVMVMAYLPDFLIVHYIEGWLLNQPDYPIEHGWLEVNGAVVDVTVGDHPATDYFPIFRYTMNDVWRRCGPRGKVPFFLRRRPQREAMLRTFAELPIDHKVAKEWARSALLIAGAECIYLDETLEQIHADIFAQLQALKEMMSCE